MADLDAAVRISGRVDPSFDRAFRRGETTVKGLDSRLDGLGIPRGLTEGTERASRGLDRLDGSGRRAARGIRTTRDGIRGLDRQARSASDGIGRLGRRLDGLRSGGGLTAAGIGIGVGGILAASRNIRRALEEELAEIRLRTVVVTDDDPRAAAARLRQEVRELSQSRRAALATEKELLDGLYEASSAGLEEALARNAAVISHRVARVTDGNIRRVTQTVARSVKLFGDQIGGPAEKRVERIGDILTSVQQAEQLSDFAALGEGINNAAGAALAAEVPFSDMVAILGRLNSLGIVGPQAGTALAGLLGELPRGVGKIGAEIERADDGAQRFEGTLRSIQRSLDGLNPDDAALKLQTGFGIEAVRAIQLLLLDVGTLNERLEATAQVTDVVDDGYRDLADSVGGRTEQAKQDISELSDSLTNTLLPALGAAARTTSDYAQQLDEVVSRSPAAQDAIRGLTGSVLGLAGVLTLAKLGAIAGAPGILLAIAGAAGYTLGQAGARRFNERVFAPAEAEFERLARETGAALQGRPDVLPRPLDPALLPRLQTERLPRFGRGFAEDQRDIPDDRRGLPYDILAPPRDVVLPVPPQASNAEVDLGLLARETAAAIQGSPRSVGGDGAPAAEGASEELGPLRPAGPVVVEPLVIERGAIQITGSGSPRQAAEEVIRLLEERARQRTAAAEWDER